MFQLVDPHADYKIEYIKAMKESLNERLGGYMEYLVNTFANKSKFIDWLNTNFDAFIQLLSDKKLGKNMPPNYPPQTDYWMVDGSAFIGRVTIRHRLNPNTKIIGGHIGFYIRPSQRQKGYGYHILNLSLEKARLLGLKKVLLTCKETATASQKIILANGGVLAAKPKNAPAALHRTYYWIAL